MPTKMVCDAAMAQAVAAALAPTISATVALRCRSAGEGERLILAYDCTDIRKGKFQRDQFAASMSSMRVLVPIVSGKSYHQQTLEVAVEKVSKDLDLGMDACSVERQAYKIRAMLGHLQRMRRETRQKGADDEIYQLALTMKPAPSQGTSRKTRAASEQGGERSAIKQRVTAEVQAKHGETEPPSHVDPAVPVAAAPDALALKRRRIAKKSGPDALKAGLLRMRSRLPR